MVRPWSFPKLRHLRLPRQGPDTFPSITVPVPLFEVLNPTDAADYEQRVEPSVRGGGGMANAFRKILESG